MNYKPTWSLRDLFFRSKQNKERLSQRASALLNRYKELGIQNKHLERDLLENLFSPSEVKCRNMQKKLSVFEGLSLVASPFRAFVPEGGPENGRIIIGDSHEQNIPVTITKKDFSRHILVTGSTGSCKTSLAKWIIITNPQLQCVLIFSYVKNDFEDIIPVLLNQGRKVYLLDGDNLGVNILECCPKVSFTKHFSTLLQILSEAFEIPPYNRLILRRILRRLYEKDPVPTVSQLIQVLHHAPKEARFLLERMICLQDGLGPEVKKGRTIDKLLDLNAVIIVQLNAVERLLQVFLTKWFLSQLFLYKTENPEDARFVSVFMDEAHTVAPPGSLLEENIATLRVAAGVFAMTQSPRNLSANFITNTNTKLFGEIRSLHDLEIARQYCMLNPRQTEYLRKIWKPGTFLASFPGYPEPVLVTFPHIHYGHVSRDELNRARLPLELFEIIPEIPTEQPESELSQDAEELLVSINKDEFLAVKKRMEDLGMSFKRFQKARETLIQEGYVEEVEISLGQQKGRPKLYELTQKAKDYLSSFGYVVTHSGSGRGSLVHRFCQLNVMDHFKSQSIPVHVEKQDEDGNVPDVLVKLNSQWTPVEIVLDNREAQVERIVKKLARYPAMILVFPDKKVLAQVKEKLSPHLNGQNVRFSLISEFIS